MNVMYHLLLNKYGKENVIRNSAFLVAKGDIPVCLISHADTVFSVPPSEFYYDTQKNVLWSPQGMGADDRAGIFSIIKVISEELRPHVVITTGEESGCIGAAKLVALHKDCPFESLKFLIELDRRGFKDSVYYDCANDKFEDFITPFGFETAWGTLSDISVIAPAWKVAAVNFSVGYMEEHTKQERLYVDALFDTIEKVKNILTWVKGHAECPVYKYIENPWTGYGYGYGYGCYNYGWYDDGYDLKPYNSKQGKTCVQCNRVLNEEDMIPVHWGNLQETLYLCNNCFSHSYEDIEWCSKCKKGWILDEDDKDLLRGKSFDERSKWVCKECKEGKVSNESESEPAGNGNTGDTTTESNPLHGGSNHSRGKRRKGKRTYIDVPIF